MNVKYIALAVSLASFAIGFSDLQENMFFWLMRPMGAVAFIVFFIFAILGKEFSLMEKPETSWNPSLQNQKTQGKRNPVARPQTSRATSSFTPVSN